MTSADMAAVAVETAECRHVSRTCRGRRCISSPHVRYVPFYPESGILSPRDPRRGSTRVTVKHMPPHWLRPVYKSILPRRAVAERRWRLATAAVGGRQSAAFSRLISDLYGSDVNGEPPGGIDLSTYPLNIWIMLDRLFFPLFQSGFWGFFGTGDLVFCDCPIDFVYGGAISYQVGSRQRSICPLWFLESGISSLSLNCSKRGWFWIFVSIKQQISCFEIEDFRVCCGN